MKIKHADTGEYLGVKDDEIILSKSPQYWQVFESFKNPLEFNSKKSSRKYSEE